MRELGVWIALLLAALALTAVGSWFERRTPIPASPLLFIGFLTFFIIGAICRFIWLLVAAWL